MAGLVILFISCSQNAPILTDIILDNSINFKKFLLLICTQFGSFHFIFLLMVYNLLEDLGYYWLWICQGILQNQHRYREHDRTIRYVEVEHKSVDETFKYRGFKPKNQTLEIRHAPGNVFVSDVLCKYFFYKDLRQESGGGGIRTPVPRCFKASFYMLSRFIVFSPCQAPERQALNSAISGIILPCRPEQPTRPACCVTPLPDPQAKSGRTGRQIRRPCATVRCRLKFIAG